MSMPYPSPRLPLLHTPLDIIPSELTHMTTLALSIEQANVPQYLPRLVSIEGRLR